MSEESYNDFGILSMEESQIQERKTTLRMIICGDSGIGKTALVTAFTSKRTTDEKKAFVLEPIEVYDSNICVVDTCGYGALLRAEVVFSHVRNYIEGQFEKTNQIFNNTIGCETLTFIINQASDAFSHLDLCLYLIMGRIKPVDIEYMRSIHELVNIIPVIIQPDISLKQDMIIDQRIEILNIMNQHNIKFSYMGYPNLNALISACKHPKLHPSCPPFTLDWSSSKKSFHGLVTLKQALFKHLRQSLRYETTLKFMEWRKKKIKQQAIELASSTHNSSASIASSNSTSTSSIRISQYISHRRHSMEKELLLQEKKLRQELELATQQQKIEIILREINQLMLQGNHHSLIKAIQDQDQQQAVSQTNPMIPLSILLSIFVLLFLLCYCLEYNKT